MVVTDPGVPSQHGTVAQAADLKGQVIITEVVEKSRIDHRPAGGQKDLLAIQGAQGDDPQPVLPLSGIGEVEPGGLLLHLLVGAVGEVHALQVGSVGGYRVHHANLWIRPHTSQKVVQPVGGDNIVICQYTQIFSQRSQADLKHRISRAYIFCNMYDFLFWPRY